MNIEEEIQNLRAKQSVTRSHVQSIELEKEIQRLEQLKKKRDAGWVVG